MKIFIKILNREIGNYETALFELKKHSNIVPREGERVAVNKIGYDVKSVFYDFDNRRVILTVL